jgi:hypothetical protein
MNHAVLPEPALAGDFRPETDQVQTLVRALETHGAVVLPRLVADATLRDMQAAFAGRLERMRWNNCDGYERNERLRLMVQDVLTLGQGFVDLALHPLVKAVLDAYLGSCYALCEAKGWKSLPTRHDFHGWHGDMWYDQSQITDRVPREVKLAFYLSDVKTGAFQYIRGSHGHRPHHLQRQEVDSLPLDRMIEFTGPAGTAVLFDTSGIHRQGIPILEPRQAIFYNYHDPAIPLQQEDVEYYRYHPLLLNAAFLGDLTSEDKRILGFGNKTHYQPGFARKASHRGFQGIMTATYGAKLWLGAWSSRIIGKLKRMLRIVS